MWKRSHLTYVSSSLLSPFFSEPKSKPTRSPRPIASTASETASRGLWTGMRLCGAEVHKFSDTMATDKQRQSACPSVPTHCDGGEVGLGMAPLAGPCRRREHKLQILTMAALTGGCMVGAGSLALPAEQSGRE